MTVSATTIEVGKCYTTGLSEQRRVIEADFTKVKYELIGGKNDGSKTSTVSREKFAAEVDREIDCPD